MATVQQSIEVRAPAQLVYDKLIRFNEYSRFMEDVESVEQTDESHLHWTTTMANRTVEWDAEIIGHEEDHYIAWHNVSGPTNAGKVEVEAMDQDRSQVTFTLRTEPEQVPGSMAGYTEEEMAQRLKQDLARMKDYIETGSAQDDATKSGPYEAGSMSNGRAQDQSASRAEINGSHSKQLNAAVRQASAIPMRHLGQMPQDTTKEEHGGVPSSDAMGKTMLSETEDYAASTFGSSPLDMNGTESSDELERQTGAGASDDTAQPANAGTSAAVGANGGTDAAAGAQLSGSKGGPGGASLRETADATGVPGTPGGTLDGNAIGNAAGGSATGGDGLGRAATAGDTRTGTGTTSGSGTALTGGGMSGARDAGISPSTGNS